MIARTASRIRAYLEELSGETFRRSEQTGAALRLRGAIRDRGAGQCASFGDWAGAGRGHPADLDGDTPVAQPGERVAARTGRRSGAARRGRFKIRYREVRFRSSPVQ